MTEPLAGDELGIAPRLDHTLIKPPVTSRNLVSTESYTRGTEFGGVAGLIQPPPHVPTAHERLMMVYAIDPTDPGTEDGSIVAPELEGF
jgi:hypothetical protein